MAAEALDAEASKSMRPTRAATGSPWPLEAGPEEGTFTPVTDDAL